MLPGPAHCKHCASVQMTGLSPASLQVIDVCRRANPRLVIKRAKFSALVRRELDRSVQTLGLPDENASKAVDARQEIDLRIGASFTRFQTLLLQVLRTAQMWPLSALGGTIVKLLSCMHSFTASCLV